MTTNTSAPGADQLSSPADVSTSPANASQTGRGLIEPTQPASICKAQAGGHCVTRRNVMNLAVRSAALVTATSLAVVGRGHLDPIFEAIESHKVAHATWLASHDRQAALARELPSEMCKSWINAWEERIVETDDPRWIESEREIKRTSDAEQDAAVALVTIRPTTLSGVQALLRYANEADPDGKGWPDRLHSDDARDITRTWQFFLVESLEEAIGQIASGRI